MVASFFAAAVPAAFCSSTVPFPVTAVISKITSPLKKWIEPPAPICSSVGLVTRKTSSPISGSGVTFACWLADAFFFPLPVRLHICLCGGARIALHDIDRYASTLSAEVILDWHDDRVNPDDAAAGAFFSGSFAASPITAR